MKTITIIYNTSYYIYKFRLNLIKELQKQGYQIVTIAPYDDYSAKLKGFGIKHHNINMSQYGMNPLKELITMYEIYSALKKYNPEYSLHYTIKPNIFGNIVASLAGVKVINNIAGAGKAFSNDGVFQKFIKLLFKYSLSKSEKVFFQNFDDMNLFLDNGIIKKSICERIPGSGVDLEKYNFIPLQNSKTINFLFIGRLLKQKGIKYYLEAAEKVLKNGYDLKFFVVGEYEENNTDYIDKKVLDKYLQREQIHYYGSVSPDEIPNIISNAHCVVLPSYYREGVPRSLLEAAAMGKPIITTDNVGCREVVDEGKNGFKCEIKNADCLAEKMVKFIELPFEKKLEMSDYGRKKIEKEFDEKIVIQAYLDTINQNI